MPEKDGRDRARPDDAAPSRLIWDLPVRVFHAALILSFIGAFVTNKLGVAFFKYHELFGYSVILLIGFRLIWGVVGTRHALFWNFVPGPRRLLAYVAALRRGEHPHYAGHNPLGALMVLLLLGGLGLQAILGLFSTDDIFNVGPLFGLVSKSVSLQLSSIHRRLFYWLAGAVALHIAAVIGHRVFFGEALYRAMITGRKPAHSVRADEAIPSSRLWLAVLILLAIGALLLFGLDQLPAPDSGVD